jgi:hypothetical protein
MGLFDFAFKSNADCGNSELPAIFPLSLRSDTFIKSDILHTYTKILTDVMERSHGIPEKQEPLLWDSCLQNESSEGLVTLLARAMSLKQDLYLVWKRATGILRKATPEEETQIRADYKAKGESKVGVFISFKNYMKTDMLEIYSSFEYCVLGSLNKTLNISKAVQIKINDLRASVSLNDSQIARDQARSIAKALGDGKDVMLDAKDLIDTSKPDTSSTEKAIGFLDAKRAFLLCLPISYISGLQTPGIGSTGEADMRAVERGLRQYFVSICRPVVNALFGVDLEFKSQDFREVTTGLEVLKTFDLVSDTLLSQESKQNIIARVFGLDPDKEQKVLKAEAAAAEAEANANPPANPNPNPNDNPKPPDQTVQ